MTTPILGIPEITENQAGKHLTHNQAIRDIEAILAGGVKSHGDNTPPGSPVDGDAYIIGTSATGDWAGQDENITYWDSSAWQFLTPREGLTLWVDDVDEYFRFETGSPGGWVSTGIAGAGSDALLASNNLSDVGSASTSRTNLGLGSAAVEDVGTSAGDLVERGTGGNRIVFGNGVTQIAHSATINDDAVHTITTGRTGPAVMNIMSNEGVADLLVRSQTGGGIAKAVIYASDTDGGNNYEASVVSSAPTGTTGTDGKITISANDTNTGTFYIENRRGGASVITYMLLG